MTSEARADNLEQLEALLWELHAVSVTVTDHDDKPIFEPAPGETPLWANLDVCALFEQQVDAVEVVARVEALGHSVTKIKGLADKVWEREWMSRFHAMRFGHRLWICPSGEEVIAENAVVVRLDPGLAFGTGTHATTRMCLRWLDGYDVAGKHLVDYGSGSGVLGIAALLLGAKEVLAIDNDPQALRASRDNAARNDVSEHLHTSLPQQLKVLDQSKSASPHPLVPETYDGLYEGSYDLVIANILAQPLVDLSATLISLLKPGGDLLLSGIMASQKDWVMSAYEGNVVFGEHISEDGWVCLNARK